MKYDAIVIGAGHNGLVTAAYLARAGQSVLILEQREVVGGAMVTEETCPGFKFDSGASSVDWLHPRVVRDLELSRHGLEILRPDPSVYVPLPGGGYLALGGGSRVTVEAIRRFSPADAERWGSFSAHASQLVKFLEALYSVTPPKVTTPNRGDVLALLGLGGHVRKLGRRNVIALLRTLPMSVVEFLDEWFESDVLKGALGARGITGVFQGPYAAGTAFVLLHHLMGSKVGGLRSLGIVCGGVGNLAQALLAAAKQHGVEIRTNTQVAQVIVQDDQATGVFLKSGEEILARRVISNADPKRTFLGLVDPLDLDTSFLRQVRNIKFRGVCAKVNLALDELPRFAGLSGTDQHPRGLIAISPSLDYLERAYDDAKYGGISRQPYLEAIIPSLFDRTLAPTGKHVMSVWVQYAPYHLKDGVWDDEQREKLGDRVVETLSEYAPDLKGIVRHRQVLTPLDLERIFGLTEGNIYHGDLTLDQIFFLRPVPGWAQYRAPIGNLYLCGAGTHPGGGVTGAPGFNAAREILKDVKREPYNMVRSRHIS